MKLNIICVKNIFLFLWIFVSGCTLQKESEEVVQKDPRISTLEARLSVSPCEVSSQLDSILSLTKDSFSYHSLLLVKSKAKLFQSEFDSMRYLLNSVEDFCQRQSDSNRRDRLLADLYNMKGNFYARVSAVDTASIYFDKAYKCAQRGGHKSFLPDIAINLADSYIRRGRFDLGAFWYWRVLSLYDTLQVPNEKRFPAYFGLAQVHMELRDFAMCDSLYDIAGQYLDKMLPFEKHIYLNNRGNSYYYREDYAEALRYFRSTQQLVNKSPEMDFERNLTNVNLGEVFLLLNQTDSAAFYLNQCYDYFRSINNTSALYYIDTQLIELALKQGDVQLARQRIRDAVKPDYVEPNMIHIRNKYIQHYYEKSGNFKEAYFFQRENARIDDSIRNERIKMRNSELALKYSQDSLFMKNEILIRQQENKVLRLQSWIFVLGLGTLFLGAVAWGILLYRRRKNEQKFWQMQMAINSQRLKNIRNRISPHFIFNVLNHEMSRFKDDKDKDDMYTLVHMIRRNLELADKMGVSLSDELDFVESYLSLEKQTLGDDFMFIRDVDKTIDLNKVYVPSMFLHLLVENSIKHSLSMKEGKRRLWLRIYKEADRIHIKLRDNGGGFNIHSRTVGTGTGLKVITQTIHLFNQYNKKPILMEVNNVTLEDGETGCEISYSIPLNYSFQLNN